MLEGNDTMSLNDAISNAQILATERLQPHHVIQGESGYMVAVGYNTNAVENVFPSDMAYGGNACRNGQCG